MATRVQAPPQWKSVAKEELGPSPAMAAATAVSPASTAGSTAARRAFSVEPLKPADRERLLHFLRRFFFRDEPLNVAVQLLGAPGEPEEPCLPLEDYCASSLGEPYSLAAVCPSTGELLGVCLNGSSAPGPEPAGAEAKAKAEACPHPRFKRILRLLAEVDARTDLFSRFPAAPTALEVRVLSVDGACRGMGIATALLDRTRELAREHAFPLVRCDCTSAFSARAVARLGFRSVSELRYDEYLGPDGKPVFQPAHPHTQVASYVYEV